MFKINCGLLALGFLSLLSPLALAQGGFCGKILFDCDHHIVTVGHLKGTLDCGLSTPRRHHGKIGTKGLAAGSIFRCLKGKPKVDVGLGKIIVHSPCGGRRPKGQNQRFGHSGCLNVSAEMLAAIGRCQHAPFDIQYASKGGADDGARVRFAARWRYRRYASGKRNSTS